MNRNKKNQFTRDYTKNDLILYLQGVKKLLGKSPVYRDLKRIPGPSAATIIRRFGSWSKALKTIGMRPHTLQLMKGEKTYVRQHWRNMTDKGIAKALGISFSVVRYYRMNFNLWKNRKGTSKTKYRNNAFKLYGQSCEVCGLKICEWHHIVPKSTDSNNWCILCPICHAVITRKYVVVQSREEIFTHLLPYMQKVYSHLKFNSDNDNVYTLRVFHQT